MTKGKQNTIQDFWNKVDIKTPNECWIWQGHTERYGHISYQGKKWGAHRLSWTLSNSKDIPNDMYVCHHCDNPRCVNPNHLFLGTTQDNTRDKTIKGRQTKGEEFWSSKLTEQDILDIRNMPYGNRGDNKRIQLKYNISGVQVRNIINRKHWKHI